MNHPHKLMKQGSVLVVVDVQDKLLHAIHDWQTVLANDSKMVKFAKTLDVPIIVTEQYPKGLGATNKELATLCNGAPVLEKTVFSCFGAPGFAEKLDELKATTLVIVGIEAHICVQQTALEALARGFNVHVLADAVGSRSPLNKEIGLAKIRQAGGVITSVEIALYEWLVKSDGQEFKAILPLIK
jgi:nicotinamidase-related amidase